MSTIPTLQTWVLVVKSVCVCVCVCVYEAGVKRFFSFTFAFQSLDFEGIGIMAILSWLKLKLGNICSDADTVKELEAMIAAAQHAAQGDSQRTIKPMTKSLPPWLTSARRPQTPWIRRT